MTIQQSHEARFGAGLDDEHAAAFNPAIGRMLDHRSCRQFEVEPVPDNLLHAVLSAAFSAPSKSDLQQRSVIRVREREKLRRISRYSPGIGWISQAPVFLVWCGDSRRIRRLAEHRGHPFANDHLDAFMNAAVDTGLAMQAFITAAEAAGLGCCPVSEVRNRVFDLSRELALPEHVFPVAGMAVGWPAETPPVSMRLPLAVTVHEETYDDADLPAQVAAYDRRRESVDRTPDHAQFMADRFGVSEDYGWSERRTRQYAVPARTDFGRYVREQGFCLD